MALDVKQGGIMTGKYDIYTSFDLPVPYKNLLIYPALVKDVYMFNYASQILILEKQGITGDIETIKRILTMSDLEYIYATANTENGYMSMLHLLLRLVLRKDVPTVNTYVRDEEGRGVINIDDTLYTGKDFAEIKQIICESNDVELPDQNIDYNLRLKLEESKRIKAKSSTFKMGSFEDQMICVAISTGYKLEEIYNMTIRKFNKMMLRIDHKLNYEINKTASMSGFVEFKDKSALKHWMADLTQNIEDSGTLIDAQSFTEKIEKSGG